MNIKMNNTIVNIRAFGNINETGLEMFRPTAEMFCPTAEMFRPTAEMFCPTAEMFCDTVLNIKTSNLNLIIQ